MGDFRYAIRAFLKNRVTTAVTVLSLALGIGANIALFTVFNAIIFKPLPARDPDRVANVYTSYPEGARYGTSSWPDYVDYRNRNQVFEGLAAWHAEPVNGCTPILRDDIMRQPGRSGAPRSPQSVR
jgi:hypothetical protein